MAFNLGAIADYGDSKCGECKGFETCTNVCMCHTGQSFINYLKGIDTIDTKIGTFESTSIDGPKDLIVCGHEMYNDGSLPSWILRRIELVTLNTGDKFTKAFNKNSSYILSSFCKVASLSSDETNELIKKLENINKMKSIIVPIKPSIACNIDYTDGNEHILYNEIPILKMKWVTDSETKQFKCEITFKIEEKFSNGKIITLGLEDYNRKFTISNMEISKKGKHDNSIIEMTNYGLVRPIEIIEGEISTIIDGTYVYNSYYDESIVGVWNNKGKISFAKNYSPKVIKFIETNLNIIKLHRKYIAPYKMCDTHKLKIK